MNRSWVADRFGVECNAGLVELALRRNPKRAHLLVSTVLGKHIPTDPRVVHATGLRLGAAVRAVLSSPDALVLGYAETATGLGHCVAEELGAQYLHSTRREVPTLDAAGSFEEAHSHATGHLLLPEDPDVLHRDRPVVLVDDELSTGATALNTIAELHRIHPHSQYVIAALVDVRDAEDRDRTAKTAASLGVPIEVVALETGTVTWPADFPARAAEVVEATFSPTITGDSRADVVLIEASWPTHVREGGRHGFGPADVLAARAAAGALAARIGPCGGRMLVLGTEELMYAPLLVALALAERLPDVRYSTTTRSPVVAIDEPGYPIRTALDFDADGARFAYNIGRGFTDIVVIADDDYDLEDLVPALGALCDRVHVAVLPTHRTLAPPLRGPAFGSYAPDEVGWLLTDLSGVELEAPTEEREEAIQSGGAHYAESLPIEYQPTAEYQELFRVALEASATRIAHAVGVVTELVLDLRGHDVVLASLARAGTPVGVLMRRWAAYALGLDVAHYGVSIVRGRGIDQRAVQYLAARHDPRTVMFVDGWTGKGAIARELAAAVDDRFDATLAVLADPGSCASVFGTRADFLIPSACLNSTVSGLVSRTVLNDRLLAPGQYHGAKYYRDLAGSDVSARFVDAITAAFPTVAADVARDWPTLRDADRAPTWAGWRAVEQITTEYGIGDVNLVKPGVGETTRVLLRRVPWRILVRDDAAADLAHVLLLASQRGVEVETVPGLAYSCVGLIHPRYTRGATGADGRAV
jgi:adenine/guanine phosphoribosyltransferase-like PRPP-binding protein